MKRSELPQSEYNPFYRSYVMSVDEDASLMDTLINGRESFLEILDGVPENRMGFHYAEGKWTLAELVGHVIDAERVFQYRALRFARRDKTALPGFEQDGYVSSSEANSRSKKDLLEEYKAVRESTIQLYSSFTEDMMQRVGVASGSEMSVRALGFVICGHQAHHLRIIRERYL